MSGGNGGAPAVVLRLVPVDPERGRVDVRATLPPEAVREALADGGPLALVIAGALLRTIAAESPEPVATAAREAAATLDARMAEAARRIVGAGTARP